LSTTLALLLVLTRCARNQPLAEQRPKERHRNVRSSREQLEPDAAAGPDQQIQQLGGGPYPEEPEPRLDPAGRWLVVAPIAQLPELGQAARFLVAQRHQPDRMLRLQELVQQAEEAQHCGDAEPVRGELEGVLGYISSRPRSPRAGRKVQRIDMQTDRDIADVECKADGKTGRRCAPRDERKLRGGLCHCGKI
jgi:hypothetical protein